MELYNLNEVVWGKVRGYPWWPGVILAINEEVAKVHFIGDDS